ncbi:GNAT family N-acetyltransferase [Paraneptunicella aestuarii]|uniref:GNAT family N-acetyltransferase n=1 Tax=Paraneptunicella aestuarii TaxID=2831148 RepID=UPI001E3AF2C7|nr:GNAT family N-acetyltransferase [Paraneptunicella aestuarii]UAA39369.1 GNAT family N-acetyltransferase [Paraneptunicella aestuarii]
MTEENKSNIRFVPFTPEAFDAVIELGNLVHGDNYLDNDKVQYLYNASLKHGINASLVAYMDDDLVGFRLTQAPEQWDIDEWCSPELWGFDKEQVCYFKCNTVHERCRGTGIGSELLKRSIEQAKKQGAKAGLAHIWLASPGNSAYKYFKKCGGELVKEHPNRWQGWYDSHGYICPVCGEFCTCTAAEMMIKF